MTTVDPDVRACRETLQGTVTPTKTCKRKSPKKKCKMCSKLIDIVCL